MTINLRKPDITELKPRITVFGVGGGGGNAVNNMINAGLRGVEFVCANTDAQALAMSKAEKVIQLGANVTEGLGAGSQPEVGRAAAEECIDEILDQLTHTHMCFVTAGMGGGTGTGAAPVVARAARERGILTVGVVTKPFHFEGQRRMRTAELGIEELQACVDTLLVIPNQNLFRIANDKTTFADAFAMADQVLYSGVACITDLMVKEGLINLDFADVRSVMREMGKAMMGTGEASGDGRAMAAAEAAIANPLLDETSMKGAKGLLISITGGRDMTLFEVDEAATRIREEVDPDANIILGATFDEELEGVIRVSVVATGIDKVAAEISAAPTAVRTTPRPAPQLQQKPAPQAAQAPQPAAARAAFQAEPSEAALIDQQIEAVARAAQPAQQATQPQQPAFQPQSNLFRPVQQEAVARAPMQQSQLQPQARPAPAMQPQQAQPQQQQQMAPQHHQQAPVQQPRMPQVADFPPVVQAEISRAPAPVQEQEDRGPMGLLKRLTQGLSRREEDDHTAQPPEPRLRQAEPRRQAESQFYAPARGQLDDQGRLVPQARQPQEEDQLEIPAFLRRQAN
jgi:cell division protein FtsZ